MLPKKVHIREVGLREGVQTLTSAPSLPLRCEVARLLAAAGLTELEVCAFVRPDRVPAMADAEELVAQLPRESGVTYTGLYLNEAGFLRAVGTRALAVAGWIHSAASADFLRRNMGSTPDELVARVPQWRELFSRFQVPFRGIVVSSCFGCNTEGPKAPGDIVAIVERIVSAFGQCPQEIVLADTMGWGVPTVVEASIKAVRRKFPEVEVSVHLHDSRGAAMANAYAALQCGITTFETSVGGVGGCPFVSGAAGNLATEDFVFLCEGMGIHTGVDIDVLVRAATVMTEQLGIASFGRYTSLRRMFEKNR